MIRKITLLAIAAAFAAPAWTAERGGAVPESAPKEEKIGVGSGAAIGAAAGGPVGFVVGAALGGWVGNKFHREREQRVATEEELERAQGSVASLERMLHGNEQELAGLEAELQAGQREHRAALERALDIEIFFRTAQTELDADAEERLARLGALISDMDDLTVLVEGHADARGDETYNQELSAARAQAVRDVLVGAGVETARITTRAEGERFSAAEDADLDALALDRRVHLSIVSSASDARVAQE